MSLINHFGVVLMKIMKAWENFFCRDGQEKRNTSGEALFSHVLSLSRAKRFLGQFGTVLLVQNNFWQMLFTAAS